MTNQVETQPEPNNQETKIEKEVDLASKLSEAEQQVDQYKDLLLRKAAEFENYKKRVENESATIVKFATEELIVALLPIVDDLERSLKLSKDRKDSESFYRGIELIYQKLLKVLQDQGVQPLETVGTQFNVDFHDALMQLPRQDVPPHTILEEVEKGYTLHKKVIRHAKVIVSSAPATEEAVVPGEKPESDSSPEHFPDSHEPARD